MMKNSDIFTLPAGPAELCFDKNEFMKTSFSVDDFLHQHKNAANLETIRDDLGIYLKVLRSAMIELINEDYADFVNLSANLIGLDQSINKIQKPLELLQEEINGIQQTLNNTMREITDGLDEKNELREQKRNLQCQVAVEAAMIKINNLLELSDKQKKGSKTMILERMTLQAIQLNFNIKYCEHLLSDEKKMDAQNMLITLLERIKEFFLLTLNTKDIAGLERCLKIYSNLDECHSAELIFKNDIISPYLNNIISEHSLQNCPQGLSGLYKQILDIFPNKMSELLTLTRNNENLKGFDFIINSFWIDVERLIETRMSSIFAPGNPDIFYQKYISTLEFLEKIENFIENPSIIELFRKHKQYKNFQTRWNLPVYFQIRFQEIGGSVETGCNKQLNKTIINKSNELKLIPFYISFISIKKCWQNGIYLPQIFTKFWKLTLQILSRQSKWINDVLILNINEWNQDDMDDITKIDFFILIYVDILKLIEKLTDILNVAIEKIPIELNDNITLLEICINETKQLYEIHLKTIEKLINKELINLSQIHIKLVNDIPRLYRKTNKEVPSKPCAYLKLILGPIENFRKQYLNEIDNIKMKIFLNDALSTLTVQYYTAVEDVLISVQKTEESLRRLKNLREKQPVTTSNNDRTIMSDDDKIRLQLQVDVINWSKEIENLDINIINVTKLTELINLVEDALKIKINDK